MDKKIARVPSPDITDICQKRTPRHIKKPDVVDDASMDLDDPGKGIGRGKNKRGAGRPRGRPKKGDNTGIKIEASESSAENILIKIEKDVQDMHVSEVKKEFPLPSPDEKMATVSVANSFNSEEKSSLSVFDFTEETPSYKGIPGLDLLDSAGDQMEAIHISPLKSKMAASKSAKEILSSLDEQEEDATKIRRSSRIKTLEEQRGSRGRRREVVFASDSSNKNLSLMEDDSNSNSMSPTREESSSGFSSGLQDLDDSNSPSKPLKVKSRWRYSSDAESMKSMSMDSNSNDPDSSIDLNTFVPSKDLVRRPGHLLYEKNDTELVDKLKKFQGIEESIFRKSRNISKESKGMVCDCFLTNEDMGNGDNGCEEDCLNRLLMVECGPRCPTGERCKNKKFQRKQYATLEVFKTDKKGHGLRTLHPIPEGGFVIEYVGEVLDPYQFENRTAEYAKGNQEHFYFMALKSDSIIDATVKGNCSRFINHSCEPNCETQKWTVNGELRIGFFTICDLKAGDEIVFDYQFQRYGKKAQRCFCLTPSCRGWIGEVDEEDEEEEEEKDEIEEAEEEEEEIEEQETVSETVPRVKKVKEKKPSSGKKVGRPRKPRAETSRILEDVALEEELGQLERSGLKNRNHTLTLSRLMVRAEKWDDRERLINILITGDPACRRLFLDYRGLKLLYNWMINLPLPNNELAEQTIRNQEYHLLFLRALASLSISNKTMLLDSKMLSLIETWAAAPSTTTTITNVPLLAPEISSIEPPVPVIFPSPKEIKDEIILTPSTAPAESLPVLGPQEESDIKTKTPDEALPVDQMITVKEEPPMLDASVPLPVTVAAEEKMEVDDEIPPVEKPLVESLEWTFVTLSKTLLSSWADLKEVFRIPKKERVEQMKEHEREADKSSALSLADTDANSDGRSKWNVGKDTRRERRIPTHDSYNPRHRHMFSHLPKEQWRSMFAAKAAQDEEDMRQRRMQEEIVSLHQHRCTHLGLDPSTTPMVDISGHYYLDPKTIQWKTIVESDPDLPRGIRQLMTKAQENNGLPMEQPVVPVMEEEVQPEYEFPPWPEGLPPPPPFPPAELPAGWKMAIDDEGRCYYYHVRLRISQWYPPSVEDVESATVESSDSTDSEELENEEISADETGAQVVPQQPSISVKPKHRKLFERNQRRKNSGLVRERIISPRTDDDKSLISKSVIRARKLEVQEEKRRMLAEEASSLKAGSAEQESPEDLSQTAEGTSTEEVSSGSPPVSSAATTLSTTTDENPDTTVSMSTMSMMMHDDEDDEDNMPSSPIETELDISLAAIKDDDSFGLGSDINSVPPPATSAPPEKIVIIPGLDLDPSRLLSTSSTPTPPQGFKARLSKHEKKPKQKPTSISHKKQDLEKSNEAFRKKIADVVVGHLNPYRKPDCKSGRIVSTEDFKHLARKMTHAIFSKELKNAKEGKILEVTDSVKQKTKEYIKKYMGRYSVGSKYTRSPDRPDESQPGS